MMALSQHPSLEHLLLPRLSKDGIEGLYIVIKSTSVLKVIELEFPTSGSFLEKSVDEIRLQKEQLKEALEIHLSKTHPSITKLLLIWNFGGRPVDLVEEIKREQEDAERLRSLREKKKRNQEEQKLSDLLSPWIIDSGYTYLEKKTDENSLKRMKSMDSTAGMNLYLYLSRKQTIFGTRLQAI